MNGPATRPPQDLEKRNKAAGWMVEPNARFSFKSAVLPPIDKRPYPGRGAAAAREGRPRAPADLTLDV